MRTGILLCTTLLVAIQLVAQEKPFRQYGVENEESALPVGLKVGDKAPNFVLESIVGERKELLNKQGKRETYLVLNFYRGTWCPVCVRYLSNLQDSLKYIQATGAEFWAVTPESRDNAADFQDKVSAGFPILLDTTEKVMKSYDVLFDVTETYQAKVNIGRLASIAANNENDEARLPVPATYIIDPSGKIIFRQFDFNYKNRASVKRILQALNGGHEP